MEKHKVTVYLDREIWKAATKLATDKEVALGYVVEQALLRSLPDKYNPRT